MKFIDTVIAKSITKESQCKLSSVTQDVSSFGYKDLQAALSTCYTNTTGGAEAILQRRVLGTIINAVFTEQKPVFFISKAIIQKLMAKDTNYRNKTLSGADYGRIWAFITNETKVFSVVRDGSSERKATVLELADQELLTLLKHLVSEAYIKAMKEQVVNVWDSYDVNSQENSQLKHQVLTKNENKISNKNGKIGGAQRKSQISPETEIEYETETEHDPDYMNLESYESSQGLVQMERLNKSSDRPVQAGSGILTLKATPVGSQSPSYPPVLNRRYLKLKSDDDSFLKSYREAQFPDFGVIKGPTLEESLLNWRATVGQSASMEVRKPAFWLLCELLESHSSIPEGELSSDLESEVIAPWVNAKTPDGVKRHTLRELRQALKLFKAICKQLPH